MNKIVKLKCLIENEYDKNNNNYDKVYNEINQYFTKKKKWINR
jgi:hypothetical protein